MRKIIFTWVVVVAIVLPIFVLIFYTLPKIDSMYISSDTYKQKNKSNQDGKNGVKVISKVEQSENGIYFVYKGRLMYMENSDGNINEICKIPSEIVGVLAKDNTVFLRECDNVASIYKVNANGEIVKIANDSGKMYMEGENIYTLNARHGLRKYDFSGKMIFSNKEALDFTTSHTIFDDYIFYKWYQNERIALSVPQYYRLDVNKIKYLLHEVKFSRYYLEPEEWDSYNRENVIEYDDLAKEVDKEVRTEGMYDQVDGKDLGNYDLQSIELSVWNFSDEVDRYIYLYGNQKITYLDKEYKRKSEEMTLEEEDNNREKFTYQINVKAVFRISIDEIKNSSNETYVNYERVSKSPDISGDWSRFIVDKNNVYVINEDEYTDKEAYRNLYIYSIDVKTGLNKEVYKKKRFFLGNDSSEIFATDKYIFIYEYGDYGEKQCITRINRDGSNPILVMDGNGEVVMKPIQ
ncbi:hypothetical protein [Lachnoanaerobaculum saburreum]|uniref:DUF5050 domain-containing protein n=1 Tax=Lachnoanaerobaculum saburreum TaxID=467210 RepID=A0A133ZNB7_9FIRM|nr:hypothetical protein [Lachnoanaerobaculum saburreum]KXB56929.1 hypothetical protein HMPREF1866_01673 [Lachnoanaerobaculum saburreum]